MQFFLIIFLLCLSTAQAKILLDDVMSEEVMERTGVDQLDDSQFMELETWINDNFDPKEGCCPSPNKKDHRIYLSLNFNKGIYLEFSDGRTYEIALDDRLYSAFWITPFPAEFTSSGDADFPIKITNLNSQTSVRGKEVSTREILHEEMEVQQNDSKTPDSSDPNSDPSIIIPPQDIDPTQPSSQQAQPKQPSNITPLPPQDQTHP